MIIFIFPLFQPFATYIGLKLAHNGVSYFFHIFCYVFGILHYASGRNETELLFLFPIFFSLFQPILAGHEATTIFLKFFNFFAILLEFYITCRAGTERNNNFYFLAFPSFPNLFWLKMNP